MSLVRWAFRVGSWQPSEGDWMRAACCIQAEEKERIGRFVFRKDAKSSMAGRLLIRKFVAEATSLRYSEVKLGRDERGKPFLATPHHPGVQFNVSHQGEFAVLAGALGPSTRQVGVDVMKVEYSGGKSQEEFFRIMGRNFSSKEWGLIRSSGGELDRLTSFCRHWSLKESYVKATGTGITVSLQDISFETRSPLSPFVVTDTALSVGGRPQTEWVFEESLLDDQHCVALARDFPAQPAPFQLLNFQELTESSEALLPEDQQYCRDFFSKDEKP